MTDKTEAYNCTILFLLSINETDVNLMEIGDFDHEEVWGMLEVLDDRKLIDLSKTHAFINGRGRMHLKQRLLDLENKLTAFVKSKETDISKSVNITEFMESYFIKPDPTSKRTTNDRDPGVYFIKYMKSKNLIKYDEINLSHINYWCTDDPGTIKMWFNNLNMPLFVELINPLEESNITQPARVPAPVKRHRLSFIKDITAMQWQLLIALLGLIIALYWVFK